MTSPRPTAGRSLVTGVLAVALAAGVAGCSTAAKVQTAAIVDGDRISSEEVVRTTQQFNDHLAPLISQGQKIPEQTMVSQLVLAHYVNRWLADNGGFKGDAQYAAALALVPDPAPGTTTFLQSYFGLGGISQAGQAEIIAAAQKGKIEVNPRYGRFVVTPGQVGLTASTDNWIKPGSPDPAATAPAAPPQ